MCFPVPIQSMKRQDREEARPIIMTYKMFWLSSAIYKWDQKSGMNYSAKNSNVNEKNSMIRS